MAKFSIFLDFFQSRKKALKYIPDQPSAVPPGQIVYAIGDIHGRMDLLEALLETIAQDTRNRPKFKIFLVILGDMIDRGPDSKAVLHFMFRLCLRHRNLVVLRGNHEQMLIDVIEGNYDALSLWLRYGGREFLMSFGVDQELIASDRMYDLMVALRRAVRPEIICWLKKLPFHTTFGDYFFVHAGIRPGVKIDRQNELDMLWIRDDFQRYSGPHPAVIVHGHTISEDGPEILPYRIGVDTGAYRTDTLSAIALEGTQRRILQAKI